MPDISINNLIRESNISPIGTTLWLDNNFQRKAWYNSVYIRRLKDSKIAALPTQGSFPPTTNCQPIKSRVDIKSVEKGTQKN